MTVDLLSGTASVVRTRELVKEGVVELVELRASKLGLNWSNLRSGPVENRSKKTFHGIGSIGKSGQRCLEEKARPVVSISKSLEVVGSARDVLKVNAGETVHCTRVSTKSQDTREGSVVHEEIGKNLWDVVRVQRGAAVPVHWDAFMSARVQKVSWLTSNGEERLENLNIEAAAWNFGGVVRHQVDDQVVRSWCNESRKRGGEVISG